MVSSDLVTMPQEHTSGVRLFGDQFHASLPGNVLEAPPNAA
jgi:hypothetical protein